MVNSILRRLAFRRMGQGCTAGQRRINSGKTWTNVGISDLVGKVQYWTKENGGWKILHEGCRLIPLRRPPGVFQRKHT